MDYSVIAIPMIAAMLVFIRCDAQEIMEAPLRDSIGVDSMARIGTLPNGFVYYMRNSDNVSDKTIVQLSIKVGHREENSEQTELAHLLEHVALRGSKHFPKGIYDYLEKRGLQRGRNFTASTGFSSTNYLLTLPADMKLVPGDFQIFKDIMNGLNLFPASIKAEAGAVFEEVASGEASYELTLHKQIQLAVTHDHPAIKKMYGSGRTNHIRNFTSAEVLEFYRSWYRPDLAAIIIVGKFNLDSTETMVKELFGELKTPQTHVNKVSFKPLTLAGENQFIKFFDSKKVGIDIKVIIKSRRLNPLAYLSQFILIEFFNEMLNSRFAEISRGPSPLVRGAAGFKHTDFIEDLEISTLTASARLKSFENFESSVFLFFSELERVKRFGFSNNEYLNARAKILEYIEGTNTASTGAIFEIYASSFFNGHLVSNPYKRSEMLKQQFEEVSLAEVNAFAKRVITGYNRDVIISGPQELSSKIPSDKVLNKWITAAISSKIERHIDTSVVHVIFKHREHKERNVQLFEMKDLNAFQLRLQNGITFILKPVKSQNPSNKQMVYLHGFSPGGYSNSEILVKYCASIIQHCGVGGYDLNTLEWYSKQNDIQVHPYVEEYYEGIVGSAPNRNFEKMVQLMCGYLQSPNVNERAFSEWKTLSSLANGKLPRTIFNSIDSVVNDSETNYKLSNDIENLKFDDFQNVYRDRFLNTGDFTFVVAGNFSVKDILPILSDYFGELSSSKSHEVKEIYPIAEPSKRSSQKRRQAVKLGEKSSSNRAEVELRFLDNYSFSTKEISQMIILNRILSVLLQAKLREAEGAIYYINTSVNYRRLPVPKYSFAIGFKCPTANYERLINSILEEIYLLKTVGVKEDLLEKAVVMERQALLSKLGRAEYLSQYYVEQLKTRASLCEIDEVIRNLDNVSHQDILNSANIFLNEDKLIEFVVY